jgi:hypothetical protein
MYSLILTAHSWLRWLVLVAGFAALFAVLGKGDANRLRGADRWGLIFSIALDIQLLLGLVLYGVLSPFTAQAMRDFGAAMRDTVLRFWAVEHLTMMVAAVALVHVGRVRARKAANPEAKRRQLLIFFGIALLLILGGIPWPFMANARPLFRF